MKYIYLLVIIILILTACSSQSTSINSLEASSIEYEEVGYFIDENELNSDDMFSIIEPVWWSVNIYEDEHRYNEDLARFSEPQRYVFAIQWYLSEVNNGGHDQFFYNSTGIVWEDALIGCKRIGIDECVDILQQSAKLMGGNPNKDREERQEQLEKYEPDFETLDNKLYEIEDIIEEKILNYIKNNKESFKFKGIVKIPK